MIQDVVIVGAGIAGLATSLALHRLGIPSMVLESSDSLRTAGLTIILQENAWKALDALGVGKSLRSQSLLIQGAVVKSLVSTDQPITERSFMGQGFHSVRRRSLLEAMLKELPWGTIRYSSKLISMEELGHFKLLHLADGTTIKAKVLIGCDGVNSMVAKWLGFKNPVFSGRSAIRALVDLKDAHGFGPKFMMFNGEGIGSGFLPCDDHTIYWFLTGMPSSQDDELKGSPTTIKQWVLNKLEGLPDEMKVIIETTPPHNILLSPIRYRQPWELLWPGSISKGNVCVAGDALHPMTPDLGQGGCSALEDSIALARCLGEALLGPTKEILEQADHEADGFRRIELGLKRYAQERRWRSFELICTCYIVGCIKESSGKIMSFLRAKVLSRLISRLQKRNASFDCGKLQVS